MYPALQPFLDLMLSSYSFLDTSPICACMDCKVACLAYHQGFPFQATHDQYPAWDVVASFGVFLLDILEFSDVMDLEVACICRLVAAEFALLRIDPLKYLVPGGHCYFDHPIAIVPLQRSLPFLEWIIEVGHGLGAFFGLV